MKEEDMDKRIEKVIRSVASKRASMARWEEGRTAEEQRRKQVRRRWLAYGISAAASVILLCGIGISYYSHRAGSERAFIASSESVNREMQEATQMADEQLRMITQAAIRGGTDDMSEIIAMVDSAKYKEALIAIDEAMADTVIDPTYTLERQEYLRGVNQERNYELTWLKIQVLVKDDQRNEAIRILREYVKREGDHRQEAERLLLQLSK